MLHRKVQVLIKDEQLLSNDFLESEDLDDKHGQSFHQYEKKNYSPSSVMTEDAERNVP